MEKKKNNKWKKTRKEEWIGMYMGQHTTNTLTTIISQSILNTLRT